MSKHTFTATFSRFFGGGGRGVEDFKHFLEAQRMVSLWGPPSGNGGSAAAHTTTCAARTFLQTQLSKATRYGDRFGRLNVNLKDYILGYQHQVRSLLSHPPSSVSLCPTV